MSAIRFRAVVFDMDGLVLDSETTYCLAWRQAALAMGYELSETFCASLSGAQGDGVSQRIAGYCGNDFDVAKFQRLSGQHWLEHVQRHGMATKPGFFAVLEVVRRLELPFCLATNSRRKEAEQCLAWAGLETVFTHIVARDDVVNGKPAPDIFHKAASVLGVSAGDSLVLEDSPVGIAAAVAAGSPCIFVPSQLPVDRIAQAQANWLMADLQQVADFISASFEHSL